MKKIIFVFLFFYCLNSTAQLGWWTWMHGTNAPGASYIGTIGVPSTLNSPNSEYEACEWTDLQGNFWLFGGHNSNFFFPQLWKYKPSDDTWTLIDSYGGSGVYGTMGVPSPTNHPGERGFGACTWVDKQGNLWLFGGAGDDHLGGYGGLADLWKYDIMTNMWTWMSGSDLANNFGVYLTMGVPDPMSYPRSRFETNATWVDSTGNLWLFGGMTESSFTSYVLNDLWKYDISSNTWTWMRGSSSTGSPGSYGTKGIADPANDPPARCVYSKWKDKKGNFWFWGGTNNTLIAYNDLWKYDLSVNMWTWVRGSTGYSTGVSGPLCSVSSSYDPPAMIESKACWTDKCGNFWFFGGGTGYDYTKTYEALWYYNVQNNQWALTNGVTTANVHGNWGTYQIPAATNHPSSRAGSSGFTDTLGNFWFFGGSDTSFSASTVYNDLWRFVVDTNCAYNCPSSIDAEFASTTIAGCPSLTVHFINNSSSANSYEWNFGDGSVSTSSNPTHIFNTSGQFTITLVAHNSIASDTLTYLNYITVYPSDTANYVVSNDSVCIGNSLSFTNESSSNASNYFWNFGNGDTSMLTNPSNSWTATGTYTVSLIAYSSPFGCPDTMSSPISVVANSVTANFSADPLIECSPMSVSFMNSSTTSNSWYWDFGDGTSSTMENPSHVYYQGEYTVELVSSNQSFLCPASFDTISKTSYIISDSCELFIPNVFSPNGDGDNDLFSITAIGFTNYHLEIFDRWGLKIFDSKNNADCWNGMINNSGKEEVAGTYYYLLDLADHKNKKSSYKGFLSLIR